MTFTLWAWHEKTVHVAETQWLPGKENIPGVAASKMIVFWDMNEGHYRWCPLKDATVNTTYF